MQARTRPAAALVGRHRPRRAEPADYARTWQQARQSKAAGSRASVRTDAADSPSAGDSPASPARRGSARPAEGRVRRHPARRGTRAAGYRRPRRPAGMAARPGPRRPGGQRARRRRSGAGEPDGDAHGRRAGPGRGRARCAAWPGRHPAAVPAGCSPSTRCCTCSSARTNASTSCLKASRRWSGPGSGTRCARRRCSPGPPSPISWLVLADRELTDGGGARPPHLAARAGDQPVGDAAHLRRHRTAPGRTSAPHGCGPARRSTPTCTTTLASRRSRASSARATAIRSRRRTRCRRTTETPC